MSHDLVIAGGGLAGAALARTMAEHGARVLVCERERRFRDRIRGEGMHPWGVREARALGIYDLLRQTCAHEARYWTSYRGTVRVNRRDLVETAPHGAGSLNFHHPDMQEVLLCAAGDAGAEVRRGVNVVQVTRGPSPTVSVEADGRVARLHARLVVGADGRRSRVRHGAGFTVRQDPERLVISGVLFTGLAASDDAVHLFHPATFGQGALVFPLGRERYRVYFASGQRDVHRRVSGKAGIADFIRYCTESGTPADWFTGARVNGPLATFEGADVWVDHPQRDGVVLIGDAAAASDPCWGCGLSLTLRDVRVLSDLLRSTDDWNDAARRYAAEHDRYYGALHTIESWMTEVIFGLGAEADRLREHALPQLAQKMGPDLVGVGPDSPTDEATRRRFLGT
jgi:2-polyprenyl-6-methoxyphenol hydroxylase-like FAD-dependent oxidoreductase